MAHQQEEGWPLGLRLGNARMGLVRNGDFSAGSVSFSTMLTGSTTPSTDSSSDLDTQSTGSFFHDRSITLGSLIGISSFLQLSRRSTRGRMVMTEIPSKDHNNNNNKNNKNHKLIKPWLFLSLCSRLNTDAVIVHDNDDDAPSLGQYLEAERRRRASSTSTHHHHHHRIRRNHQYDDDETVYGPNDFSPIQESNSLFVEGQVAAHQSPNREWEQSNDRYGAPIVFSCLCG